MRERKDYTPEIREEKNWVAPLIIGVVTVVAIGLIGMGYYTISLNHSDTTVTKTTEREMIEPPEEFEEHDVCVSYTSEQLSIAYDYGYWNGYDQCVLDDKNECIGKATDIYSYNGDDLWKVEYYRGAVDGYRHYYYTSVVPNEQNEEDYKNTCSINTEYTEAELNKAYNDGYEYGYKLLWEHAKTNSIGKATDIFYYDTYDKCAKAETQGAIDGYRKAYKEYLAQEKQESAKQETVKQETTTTTQKKSNTTTSTQTQTQTTPSYEQEQEQETNVESESNVQQADSNAWNNKDAHGSFIMDGQTYTY